jgi:hypothetical protein
METFAKESQIVLSAVNVMTSPADTANEPLAVLPVDRRLVFVVEFCFT